jgi:hypothetical protein
MTNEEFIAQANPDNDDGLLNDILAKHPNLTNEQIARIKAEDVGMRTKQYVERVHLVRTNLDDKMVQGVNNLINEKGMSLARGNDSLDSAVSAVEEAARNSRSTMGNPARLHPQLEENATDTFKKLYASNNIQREIDNGRNPFNLTDQINDHIKRDDLKYNPEELAHWHQYAQQWLDNKVKDDKFTLNRMAPFLEKSLFEKGDTLENRQLANKLITPQLAASDQGLVDVMKERWKDKADSHNNIRDFNSITTGEGGMQRDRDYSTFKQELAAGNPTLEKVNRSKFTDITKDFTDYHTVISKVLLNPATRRDGLVEMMANTCEKDQMEKKRFGLTDIMGNSAKDIIAEFNAMPLPKQILALDKVKDAMKIPDGEMQYFSEGQTQNIFGNLQNTRAASGVDAEFAAMKKLSTDIGEKAFLNLGFMASKLGKEYDTDMLAVHYISQKDAVAVGEAMKYLQSADAQEKQLKSGNGKVEEKRHSEIHDAVGAELSDVLGTSEGSAIHSFLLESATKAAYHNGWGKSSSDAAKESVQKLFKSMAVVVPQNGMSSMLPRKVEVAPGKIVNVDAEDYNSGLTSLTFKAINEGLQTPKDWTEADWKTSVSNDSYWMTTRNSWTDENGKLHSPGGSMMLYDKLSGTPILGKSGKQIRHDIEDIAAEGVSSNYWHRPTGNYPSIMMID